MAKISEFSQTADWKSEKHVPVIELPSGMKKGEPFTVKVSVGKEIAHPNTTEHFIAWIQLYFKPEDDKFVYDLGKQEFAAHGGSVKGANEGPAYTDPAASFTVKVNQPGELIAVSYCNIHGLWENSEKISV